MRQVVTWQQCGTWMQTLRHFVTGHCSHTVQVTHFFLVTVQQPPHGAAGVLSGDANGDGVVDPADIFYLVHYVFDGGPPPQSVPPQPRLSTSSEAALMAGSISIGSPLAAPCPTKRAHTNTFSPRSLASSGSTRRSG